VRRPNLAVGAARSPATDTPDVVSHLPARNDRMSMPRLH
jgi:hypothetical protein